MGRNKKYPQKNRLIALILLVSFSSFNILPITGSFTVLEAAEFGRSVDFLINTGISLYDQGRFLEAMEHFRRALIVDPRSMVAKEFIRQIENDVLGKNEKEDVSRYLAIEEELDKTESKVELLKSLSVEEQDKLLLRKEMPQPQMKEGVLPEVTAVPMGQKPKSILPQRTIALDEKLKTSQGNVILDLEQGSSVIVQGSNIKRFLNNTLEKIEITRRDQNNLLIMASGVGKGIFHIWDDSGRWTFNLTGKQKRFFSTYQEEYENMEKPIGLSEPFRITYSMDWNSFSSGRRIDTTQRQSLSISQSVSVRGETPYGRHDGSFSVQRSNKKYEMDNLTMGLTDAHIGKLNRINLRAFDFNTGISGYKFPGADLRGLRFNTPMFNDKLNYTAFWGGLPEGNYTRLSPGLGRTKEAYLEGIGLNYIPDRNNKYKFYYAHSYGPELSKPVLTDRAFGLGSFHKIGNLNFTSDVAYDDAEHISYTTSADLTFQRLNIYAGFTEDDRDFVSPLGGGPSGGSTSANVGFKVFPTKDFSISNNVVATRDRNLYNPDDPKRPSYMWDSTVLWRLDPHTDLELGYNRNDTKGSVSPGLTETRKVDLRKKIFFLKKVNTFFNYTNSTSKNFKGSASNYDRDSVSAGLGFNVIGDLYYSVNKSINFIKDRGTGDDAKSHVLDTGLNYYSRIADSPFYSRLRISYRDEEEAESVLSYLSGQDRLEFVSELDYKPNPYVSGYLGCRLANVWAEKEGSDKRIEAEVKYGLRLAWDTGLRWNTKGHVYGFVFDDTDGNGIKDKEEKGMEGVSIITTTKKTDVTDEKGYYQIRNIVGKKARINMNLSSIPQGYTLTTPSFYDIDIAHGAYKRLDFGITTRAEIVGVVFVDLDGNNQFDRGEEGLSGVTLILDNAERATTDSGGQYLFRKVSPGEHTISIDLKTLPTKYIPKVPLKKTAFLEKGATFFHNVPLRKAFQNK